MLVQLPPKWKPRPDRLSEFLAEAPSRYRWVVDLLKDGHDVYAYFNNDEKAHAVHNALDLERYVEDRL